MRVGQSPAGLNTVTHGVVFVQTDVGHMKGHPVVLSEIIRFTDMLNLTRRKPGVNLKLGGTRLEKMYKVARLSGSRRSRTSLPRTEQVKQTFPMWGYFTLERTNGLNSGRIKVSRGQSGVPSCLLGVCRSDQRSPQQ